jgi:single-stranded DNA-specific DHH superfamily exonuclease
MIDELLRIAENAARFLLEDSDRYVRVISHSDADGISSAAIVSTALFRCHTPFHVSLVDRFDESVLERIEASHPDLVVLCDMGSGQPEMVNAIQQPVLVLDHHMPVGRIEALHVNPHLAGIDGAFELSASGVAYLVARFMGDNSDLSSLAILGALGDRQDANRGANSFILKEAVSAGVVEVSNGLLLDAGDAGEVLATSLEPYFPFTGEIEKAEAFLSRFNISGRLEALEDDALRRLASALVLTLLKRGCVDAIDSLIGVRYRLKREVLSDARKMVAVVNACGKCEEPEVALSLCLRDDSMLEHALEVERGNRERLLNLLKTVEQSVREGEHIRYVVLEDVHGTGSVAEAMVRYRFPDKPFIALNRTEDMVKVSGRGTRKLVAQGLNLADALRSAAEKCGGVGGGHNIAAGASVPPEREEEFVKLVDNAVGAQLVMGVD